MKRVRMSWNSTEASRQCSWEVNAPGLPWLEFSAIHR